MANIKKSATELIGNTPLLELTHYEEKNDIKDATILAKLEYLAPENETPNKTIVDNYQMEIAEKDKEIEALLDKLATANTILIQYINKRVKELDESKSAIAEKILKMSSKDIDQKIEKITDYIDKWDSISLDDKQRIVDILIKVIYIDEDIEIVWNI